MTKIWTNPQTNQQVPVIVVREYEAAEPMLLVHKQTATSSKYLFGVRARDCRPN